MESQSPDIIDPLDAAIATVLRGLQAEKSKTNLDLIAATGIKSRTMIRILKGTRPVSVGELKLFAQALGTPTVDIVIRAERRVEQQAHV